MQFIPRVFRTISSFLFPHMTKTSTRRMLVLVAIAVLCFWDDLASWLVVRYVFGFMLVIALMSHVVRKTLLPYVDMGDAYEEATKTPLGAGLVWLGVCLILCVLFLVGAQFFTGVSLTQK